MVKTAWTPNFNQANRAIGTFIGVEVLNGETKTGIEFEYTAAVFQVEGTKDNERQDQNIEIRLTENYSPGNSTEKFAKALGFNFQQQFEEDDRGMRVPIGDNLDELDELFESLEGNVYSFKMKRDRQTGIWSIATSSIREFTIDKVRPTTRPQFQGTATS